MTAATLSFRPLMVATLAVAVLASSGCSWVRNKWGNEAEYQASRQNQPLEVPPGLDVPSTAGAVNVPAANPNAPTAAVGQGVPSASSGQAYVEGIESFMLADSLASSYRRIGIAQKIRDAGFPRDVPMDVFIITSLTEPPLLHLPYPSVAQARNQIAACQDGTMPLEPYQLISQYTLEPLLKSVAEGIASVDVRYACEFISCTQEPM